jgi:hypothetical protein
VEQGTSVSVINNNFIDINYFGVYSASSGGTDVNVSNNNFVGTDDSDSSDVFALRVAYFDTQRIVGNNVRISNSRSGSVETRGISSESVGERSVVSNNSVNISTATSGPDIYAIHIFSVNDSVISGNSVVIDNSNGGRGVFLYGSDRNIVSENNVDLTNSGTYDTGFSISSTADNNRGSDNVATNCGTDESDSGSGNNIEVNGA